MPTSTGEIWSWAQPWLQGDQFDAVMNYQFAIASQDFFVNQKKAISPRKFNSRANQLIFNYPFQAALVNQNLFDSHDTDRVASMFVNPDLAFDEPTASRTTARITTPPSPTAEQRQRMLQEVAWQMTFVGAPMIYYGDEAGMWSPDDPSDRQPMIWKDLAAVRRSAGDIRSGKVRLVPAADRRPTASAGTANRVLPPRFDR